MGVQPKAGLNASRPLQSEGDEKGVVDLTCPEAQGGSRLWPFCLKLLSVLAPLPIARSIRCCAMAEGQVGQHSSQSWPSSKAQQAQRAPLAQQAQHAQHSQQRSTRSGLPGSTLSASPSVVQQ